jgi:hypothetical protein
MRNWLFTPRGALLYFLVGYSLVLVVAWAVHAQTLDGVTIAPSGRGSPTNGGGATSLCLLDMPSVCAGGLN